MIKRKLKNKAIYLLGLLLVLVFLFPKDASAKSYYYKNFEVKIFVNEDSTINIEEYQTFSYSGDFTFAYRDIELKRLESVSDIEVWDNNSQQKLSSDMVEISKGFNSANIKWYYDLSDTDHTWLVKYKVSGGIGNFNDYDELYWNAIFGDRDVKVENAQIYVYLPQSVDASLLKQKMFVGKEGSTNESTNFEIIDGQSLKYFAENITPDEIVTIVVGWPKGIVETTPVSSKRVISRILTYSGFGFPIIGFIILLILWFKNGRDGGAKRSIAPEFAPPSKLAPFEVGVLIDQKADMKDLTATIVDLARRGYIKITESKLKGIFHGKNYIFDKTKSDIRGLSHSEHHVMTSLFEGKKKVTTAQLKNNFYLHLNEIFSRFYKAIEKKNFFRANPKKIRNIYLAIGGVLTGMGFVGIILFSILFESILLGAGLIITGIITMIFAFFMPARTKEGALEFSKWQGFKLFLTKTDRFGTSDNVTQEVFEQYLPFAIAMGVEDKWAKRFEDLKFTQPTWYHGTVYAHSYIGFSSSLSSSMGTISSSFSSSPSSSSGFGGGGGAGGGGGGGGGGAG